MAHAIVDVLDGRGRARRAGCRRPSRCGSSTTRRSATSPARTARSATARACSSATAGTRRATCRRGSRSATACRTRRFEIGDRAVGRRPFEPGAQLTRRRSPSPTPAPGAGAEVVQCYVAPPPGPPGPAAQGAQGVRQGLARPRRDHHGHARARRGARLRLLGPGRPDAAGRDVGAGGHPRAGRRAVTLAAGVGGGMGRGARRVPPARRPVGRRHRPRRPGYRRFMSEHRRARSVSAASGARAARRSAPRAGKHERHELDDRRRRDRHLRPGRLRRRAAARGRSSTCGASSPCYRQADARRHRATGRCCKHADLVEVAAPARLFSAEIGGVVLEDLPPERLEQIRNMLLMMDPPKHATLPPRDGAVVQGPGHGAARGPHPRHLPGDHSPRARSMGDVDFVHDVAALLPSPGRRRADGAARGRLAPDPRSGPSATPAARTPTSTPTATSTRRSNDGSDRRWRCTGWSSRARGAAEGARRPHRDDPRRARSTAAR